MSAALGTTTTTTTTPPSWKEQYSVETQIALASGGRGNGFNEQFEALSSISDPFDDTPGRVLGFDVRTNSTSDDGGGARNDIASLSSASTRLPDVGNVDPNKLREFRDSYVRQSCKGSLRRRGSFTFNELNLEIFKRKPIGRETEIKQLQNVCKKISNGQGPIVVTIKGLSGTGKTVLARQIQIPVERESGFFCTGQYSDHRNEPYTGFSQALSDLAQQIWSRDDKFVKNFVDRLEESVTDDLPILLSFVPHLTKMGFDNNSSNNTANMKKQQKGEENVNVANRANQLHLVIRKFVRVICDEKIPVVMVLDDVHWADPSSILLMTNLATDTNPYFCLITTSQIETSTTSSSIDAPGGGGLSGGTTGTMLISSFFESLSVLKVKTEEIEIEDLIYLEAHAVVCAALRSDNDDGGDSKISKLSKLVFEKTHGNPYFMLTFLQSLIDEDLLDYNLGTLSFTWNLEAIQNKSATQNVGDLTAASLSKLRPELQSILQVCSCLSQVFERDELAYVVKGVKKSSEFKNNNELIWPDDINDALHMLLTKGILTSHWLPQTYSFVHGQTKTAAFTLIPFKKRGHFQLAVGRRLVEGMDNQTKMERYLCLATDLCNAGLNLLKRSEVVHYAKWNLLAGEFTLRKGAFASALLYFETGIKCLGTSPDVYWQEHTKVALALYCGAAEAAYCSGEFEKNEQFADAVLECEEPFTIQECLRIYASRISVLIAQELFEEAVDIGRRVLKELGMVDFPKSPSMFVVIREIMKTKRLASSKSPPQALVHLPTCEDQNRIYAMGIINHLTTAAYVANPNFFLVMYLKSMRWTLKYGVTQYSPVVIGTYGVILCSVLKDAKEGFKYGEVALELAKEKNLKLQRSTTISAFYGYVHHWTQPLRHSFLPLAYGYQLGMEAGEMEIAFLNIGNHDGMMIVSGAKPLNELITEIEVHYLSMQEYHQDAIKSFLAVLYQFTLNMIGTDEENENPKKLIGSIMNENKMRRIAKEKKNRNLEVYMDDWRCQLFYFFNDIKGAVKIAETTMDYGVDVGQGTFYIPRHSFIVGMVHAGYVIFETNNKKKNNDTLTKKEIKKHLKVANTMKQRIDGWLDSGNVNVLHMSKLLNAEIAHANGGITITTNNNIATKVEEKYKDAVMAATKSGFVHDRGLSHERAAIFFLNTYKDETFWAVYHVKNAIQCYRDWGATRKVDQLESKYAELLENDESGVIQA